MEYRYLKAFLLTAQYESFSKAAELLHIAQSAVSRQIKMLEEFLGEELIIRSIKKLILTEKGKELYLLLQNFDKEAFNIFQRDDLRPIRIGILQGLMEHWFIDIIIKFLEKSKRQIEICVSAPEKLSLLLNDGRLDVVISTENFDNEMVSSLKIFDEEIVVISKTKIDLQTLSSHRWFVYSDIDNIFKISAVKSNQIITINSMNSIIQFVKRGMGIAAVPKHLIKKEDHLIATSPANIKESPIYISTLNYKILPAHIKELIEIIKIYIPQK